MSTAGPPTPPPSSATEIQDAARTVVPPIPAASSSASASTSAPPPAPASTVRQDDFTRLFPQLGSLATEHSFAQLIKVAEANDVASDSERQPTRLLLTAPLVLAYLIQDNLPPARFALARLPNNLGSMPLSRQLFGLLASTSERKYNNVYVRAQGLQQLVGQADFLDASLGAVLGTMLEAFLNAFRDRTFRLLQKAYTTLPLALAQTYLGLPAEEVLSVAAANGWAYDNATQVLTPAALPQKTSKTGSASFAPFSSLATFDFVANSVAKLET
ncbi:COP9 signalosome [Mycena metata]|uniref:COP9 signalosome n=1 Tax=Mycena metata TaxID=1033252 RepID=A0AAD7JN18_9AGAR|nr:COP9 signalosome [Mycena metata]